MGGIKFEIFFCHLLVHEEARRNKKKKHLLPVTHSQTMLGCSVALHWHRASLLGCVRHYDVVSSVVHFSLHYLLNKNSEQTPLFDARSLNEALLLSYVFVD